MDSNLQTSPPDSPDRKAAAFRRPSNDASNRQYRRRSPVSRSSSSEGNSPQHDHTVSPKFSKDDQAKGDKTRAGRDERELDNDSSRNRYSRSGNPYNYSDRQSSRSSHGYSRHDEYVRHDKRADEDSKYDRISSRSGRESRFSSHSHHSKQESEVTRSKDYSQNADKYFRDRYDGSGHRSRDKEKESPSLEHQKYKEQDSSFDRAGSGRRLGDSVSKEMDRDRRRQDRDGRGEKGDYHRSLGDRKGDYTASFEESRGHLNDSSRRERENDKYHRKEGYKSGLKEIDSQKPEKRERMKHDECGNSMEKDRYGRVLKEQFEEKSDSKNQDSQSKKLKLFSSADEKRPSLEQAQETVGQGHSNDVDITNDVNAAKVAAMKAAELVNKNLIGAGHSSMTTEQKKKLLWGSKKSTPAEESGHRWDNALFGDRERQEKFNKLMGVKGETKVEHKPDNQDGNGLQAEKQRELQMDLEKQYTAGLRRRDGRTVGLGL